jgi:hypothetical protein
MEGGCDCRAVRYRMESEPLFVHCCHCRWCQRESGSAFAEYCDREELWPAESLARRRAVEPQIAAYLASTSRCQ